MTQRPTRAIAVRLHWLLVTGLVSGCVAPLPPGEVRLRAEDMGAMQHHAPTGSALPIAARLSVDGSAAGALMPGRAAALGLSFADASTGAPVTQFAIAHEKPLHLVVVHRDLSSFAHLHPIVDAEGRFSVRVNAPSADADDVNAERAFERPGDYFVFAEVTPQGRGTSLARLDVKVPGAEPDAAIAPDRVEPDGAIIKYLTSDGRPGAAGDAYRARVRVARSEHQPGMPMLSIVVAVQQRAANGAYEDVRDLSPWLGMPGHAVVIGTAGARAVERTFLHLHAEGAGAGPRLSYMAMGNDVPPAGLYRSWVQFKHRGRVLTVPATWRL